MAKVAVFFLLDKGRLPENFGMNISMETAAPLYETVSRNCSLTKLVYSDSTAYCLHMFKKPYNTDILVIVKDLEHHSGGNLLEKCRYQAEQILEHKSADGNFYHQDYAFRAMWLPEGVAKQEFHTLVRSFSGGTEVNIEQMPRLAFPSGWILQHPDGFVVGTKNEADFLRTLLLYALGISYHFQLSRGLKNLSQAAATRGDLLSRVIQDQYQFLAQCYFQNPVIASKRSSYDQYEHLTGLLGLNRLVGELEAKLRYASSSMAAQHQNQNPNPLTAEHRQEQPRISSQAYTADSGSASGSAKLVWVLAGVVVVAAAGWLLMSGSGFAQTLRQTVGL